MKMASKYLLFIILFARGAIANDDVFMHYFNEFYRAFSPASMSEQSYNRLVNFDVESLGFMNYGSNPPEFYEDEKNTPHAIIEESEILFNGPVSKRFFLKYIKDAILSAGGVTAGGHVEYKYAGATYTFEVREKESYKVVLNENIHFPVGDDNYSEVSCSYSFGKSNDGVIKLVDVFCAG